MQQPAQQGSVSLGQIRLETWLYSIALFLSMVFYTGIPERHLYQEVFPRSTALKKVTGQLKVTPRKNIDKVAVVTNTGEQISFYCRPWLVNYSCIPNETRRTGANIEIAIPDITPAHSKNVEAFSVKVNGTQVLTYAETEKSYRKSENNNLPWLAENIALFIAYIITIKIKLNKIITKNSLRFTFMVYGAMYVTLYYHHLCIVR